MRRIVAMVACATSALVSGGAARHPLHTSLTEITYTAIDHRAHITIKLFADDFGNAVARRTSDQMSPRAPLTDAAMFTYVKSYFTLSGKDGKPVALEWGGSRRTGDLVWITLTAPVPGLSGVRVHNRLMFDTFNDQANIVQAMYDGSRQSLLFTRDDAPKTLP
ncbi:MAG: hypothetical protein M3081_05505 [Gemmatimonadota bacterium]|nr:hypothetical protein [Gemmatimonadota bacterium]